MTESEWTQIQKSLSLSNVVWRICNIGLQQQIRTVKHELYLICSYFLFRLIPSKIVLLLCLNVFRSMLINQPNYNFCNSINCWLVVGLIVLNININVLLYVIIRKESNFYILLCHTKAFQMKIVTIIQRKWTRSSMFLAAVKT